MLPCPSNKQKKSGMNFSIFPLNGLLNFAYIHIRIYGMPAAT